MEEYVPRPNHGLPITNLWIREDDMLNKTDNEKLTRVGKGISRDGTRPDQFSDI